MLRYLSKGKLIATVVTTASFLFVVALLADLVARSI